MSCSVRGRILPTVLLLLTTIAGGARSNTVSPSYEHGMPVEVRSLVDTGLSRDQYLQLADQWREFAKQHSESALAEIMIYKALYYGGEQDAEKLQAHITKALDLNPDCPEALVAAMGTALRHGKPLGTQADCYQYGLQAVRVAPDWAQPHVLLYVLACRLGRPQEARQHLVALLEKGFFTPALLDYGYNMLVSADPGGIIITNGDNDTFSCLALQAGRNIRPDVTVANLSLMTLQPIAMQYMTQPAKGFATAMTAAEMDSVEQTFYQDRKAYGYMLGNAVLSRLCNEATTGHLPRPLYLAVTLSPDAISRCDGALVLEGLLQRVVPGDPREQQQPVLNIARTLELFRHRYRLDSATDLAANWQEEPSHLQLVNNYTNVLFRLAYDAAAAGDTDAMDYGFEESLKIASFHQDQAMVKTILDYWHKAAPQSAKLAHWQEETR